MAGSKAGGAKARDTNLARDPDFYSRIGSKGGQNSHTGGFFANREFASEMGKLGGAISKRVRQAKKK